jgi:hypothetical protein
LSETVLPFNDLTKRHRGVSPGLGQSYSEAARVCLDRHHTSPLLVSVADNDDMTTALAIWDRCDDSLLGAWANEIDATEFGAYALGLAAIEVRRGMVAMQRAETQTGADYYIAPANTPADDLEQWLRLEVSGVDRGTEGAVWQRLREKVNQTREGSSNLPAVAAVVGFGAKLIVLSPEVIP